MSRRYHVFIHLQLQNYFSGPVKTKLLSESERFSFPCDRWSAKGWMDGCSHSWCLGFCSNLCKPCDGPHKLGGRVTSLWSGLKSQMDAAPKVSGMRLGLCSISTMLKVPYDSANIHRWRCSTANTSSDHSYDFFKYKILRISRNSKDSRKGQDRIVGSALLVFAPAALRPVVIIDL